MQSNAPEELLTAAETANRLRVHNDTLARWRNEGHGPPFFKLGGTYRYPADELERWIRSRFTDPAEARPLFRQSPQYEGRSW